MRHNIRDTQKTQPKLKLERFYNYFRLSLGPYINYVLLEFRYLIIKYHYINTTFSLTAFHDLELFEDSTLSTTEKKTYKIYIKYITYKKGQ